jgi:hypothetical protein
VVAVQLFMVEVVKGKCNVYGLLVLGKTRAGYTAVLGALGSHNVPVTNLSYACFVFISYNS